MLLDPSDAQWRYVGLTKRPFQRYAGHVNRSGPYRSKRRIWMQALLDSGKLPLMVIVHRCDGCHDAQQVEYDYIKLYRYTISNVRHPASIRDNRFLLGNSKIVKPKFTAYPKIHVPSIVLLNPAKQ